MSGVTIQRRLKARRWTSASSSFSRVKLGAKKDEILAAYEKNKNYGMEANGEGAQDLADRAASSYTKEFLFSLSSTERDTLQLVDEAISRIEEKLFGVCVACEGEMEKKRLEAVPLGEALSHVPGDARAGAPVTAPCPSLGSSIHSAGSWWTRC